jgi:hypothetical protein
MALRNPLINATTQDIVILPINKVTSIIEPHTNTTCVANPEPAYKLDSKIDEWIHVYTVPDCFKDGIVKVCPSMQQISTFLIRASRFYPQPIKLLLTIKHPIAKRKSLEEILVPYINGNDGSNFYHSQEKVLEIIRQHGTPVVVAKIIPSQPQSFQCGNNCQNSSISNLPIYKAVVVQKEEDEAKSDDNSTEYPKGAIDGKKNPLQIYRDFLNYYVNRYGTVGENLRLANLLISLRRWYVVESKKSGLKIPHKTARRMNLIRVLNERFGSPMSLAHGNGVKETQWTVVS